MNQKKDWGELGPIVADLLPCDLGKLMTEMSGKNHSSNEHVHMNMFPKIVITVRHEESHYFGEGASAQLLFAPSGWPSGVKARLFGTLKKHAGGEISFLTKTVQKVFAGEVKEEYHITFAFSS